MRVSMVVGRIAHGQLRYREATHAHGRGIRAVHVRIDGSPIDPPSCQASRFLFQILLHADR